LSMSFKGFGLADVLATALVIVAASVGKVLSVYGAARLCRLPRVDCWGLGFLMNTRGLTELVILDVGRTAGVLSARMFTVLAAMAIATTLVTGPILEKIYGHETGRPMKLRSRAPRPADLAPSPTAHRSAEAAVAAPRLHAAMAAESAGTERVRGRL
jgi:Kef-type K+ transport system membrane component KefB